MVWRRAPLPLQDLSRGILTFIQKLRTRLECSVRFVERKPRLHHSYVIDQPAQQAYEMCRGNFSEHSPPYWKSSRLRYDAAARASPGSTWVENIRMPRRRSLRHWCYGCTGQASSIPKRWTNLESSLFSLSFERSIGIRAGPLGRWECTGALSFALFEN